MIFSGKGISLHQYFAEIFFKLCTRHISHHNNWCKYHPHYLDIAFILGVWPNAKPPTIGEEFIAKDISTV